MRRIAFLQDGFAQPRSFIRHCILAAFLFPALICTVRDFARSQMRISGEVSSAFIKSGDGYSQYGVNNGRGTFAWRGDLFADALVSENVAFLGSLRVQQDQTAHIDYFALRVSDLASTGANLQVGQIEIPFNNLNERRFPKENSFYSLPLMNEHLTSLDGTDYRLWVLYPGHSASGNGIHLLDRGLYDLGLKIYGSIGIFDYAGALINGMISTTGSYEAQGLNSHSGFGKVLRLAATPLTGLTIGASYAFGPFIRELNYYSPQGTYIKDSGNNLQRIAGADVEWSMGFFSFYGQGAVNDWQYDDLDLTAYAVSAEGRYALTPRISVASRVGSLFFNSVDALVPLVNNGSEIYFGSYSGPWDRNVTRVEGSVLYRFSRELLCKAVFQWNRTYDIKDDPSDNVFVLQTVLSL